VPQKAKTRREDYYIILDAKRMKPDAYQLPDGYPPLGERGMYKSFPAGGPKGVRIESQVNGPVEDIYTLHYIATGELDDEGMPTFEPETKQLFDLIQVATLGKRYGLDLAESIIGKLEEMVAAGLSQAALQGELASMRQQIRRS
jgi:hypothetical protein